MPNLDLVEHPFLGIQTLVDGKVSVSATLYVEPSQGQPARLESRIVTIPPEPVQLQTVLQIENVVLARIDLSGASPIYTDDDVPSLLRVNRVANLIAARTRAGAGDRVMIHADDLALLNDGPQVAMLRPPAEGKERHLGRWRFEGTVSDTIEVWSTQELPFGMERGQALVAYHGDDQTTPGGFLAWEGVRWTFALRDTPETGLGTSKDYFGLIPLRDITAA